MRVGKSIVGIVLTLGVAASVWALKHKRGFEEDEDEDGGKFPNSWFMAQRTFPEKSLDPKLRLQGLNEAKSFMAANFGGGPARSLPRRATDRAPGRARRSQGRPRTGFGLRPRGL